VVEVVKFNIHNELLSRVTLHRVNYFRLNWYSHILLLFLNIGFSWLNCRN
jgi:hypothetical protein